MYEAVDTHALAQLRRDIKRADPVVRKALDRELRGVARVIAKTAGDLSVQKSGRFAAAWKPSIAARSGVAVVNRLPYAGQQEFGGKVWLRRGLPYPEPLAGGNSGAVGKTGRPLPIRQVPAGVGPGGVRLVQNEAQYLIKRSAPGRRAVKAAEVTAIPAVADAVARALNAAL